MTFCASWQTVWGKLTWFRRFPCQDISVAQSAGIDGETIQYMGVKWRGSLVRDSRSWKTAQHR